jgi:hypothetical protein
MEVFLKVDNSHVNCFQKAAANRRKSAKIFYFDSFRKPVYAATRGIHKALS